MSSVNPNEISSSLEDYLEIRPENRNRLEKQIQSNGKKNSG